MLRSWRIWLAAVLCGLFVMPSAQALRRQIFVTTGGFPVCITIQNGRTPFVQDFEDYLGFARAYRSSIGDARYNFLADTNDDGTVDFSDFINFAQSYGREAIPLDDPPVYSISGHVLHNEEGLANVGVGVGRRSVAYGDLNTDATGFYRISWSSSGTYILVPRRFGYSFLPDTAVTEIVDTSLVDVDFSAELLFSIVSVRVVQDSIPRDNVKVMLEREVQGAAPGRAWTGTSDLLGETVIRVDADSAAASIADNYSVRAIDTDTGDELGAWSDIPIVTWDRRWLVLDLGGAASYEQVPGTYYHDYDSGEIVYPDLAEDALVTGFLDGVDPEAVETLLAGLGLDYQGPQSSEAIILEMKDTQGWAAVRQALHVIRSSGLATYAEPLFGSLKSGVILTHHIEVEFSSSATESEMLGLIEGSGAVIVEEPPEGSTQAEYRVRVTDPLRNRILDVANGLHEHPLVVRASPWVGRIIVMLSRAGGDDRQ
jgi:hypothetical protein